MPDVLFAHWASDQAMGQQAYEASLIAGLTRLADPRFTLAARAFAGLRDRPAHSRPLPRRMVGRHAQLDRALAQIAYGAADLVHRADLRLPPAAREAVTVHDLAYLRYPDEGTGPPGVREQLLRARAVVTVSAASARDLLDEYDVQAVVVPNGVDEEVSRAGALTDEDRGLLGLSGPYLLHSGGCTARKNLAALAGAWTVLAEQHPELSLVLCGPPDPRRTQLFLGLPRTHLLGFVARPLQLRILRSATAVVVPSLYEGFGLPVLEAMAAGTPVVAADVPSLAEVAGDGAVLVPPTAEGLTAGVQRVLDGSHDVQSGLRRAKDFSWAKAAAAYADVYADCLGR